MSLSPHTWPQTRYSSRRRSRCHLHQDCGRFSNHDGGDRRGVHSHESRTAARSDAHATRRFTRASTPSVAHSPRCRWRAACSPPATRSNCGARAWMRCRGCARGLRRCACRSFAIPPIRAPTRPMDAALWANLGIGSVLLIGYCIEGRAAGIVGHRGRTAARQLGGAAAPLDEAGREQPRDRTRAHRNSSPYARPRGAQRAGALQRQRRSLGFRYPQQSRVYVAALEGDARLRRGGRGAGARLAHPGALRRHVARAGRDSRSRRRQDADFREFAPHASCHRRMALGDQSRQGEGR